MRLFEKPWSVKNTLLLCLLPAGIALMAVAWIVHGYLLDRMSREFVEDRLKDEVAFLEHQIRKTNGDVDQLNTGDYFQDVFHHAFAIQTPSKTLVLPISSKPILTPLLNHSESGPIHVQGQTGPEPTSDMVAYRKAFSVNGMPIVVIVSEDFGALKHSQMELHVWTAVVSIILILMLIVVIWLGINLAMRPVIKLKSALTRLQSGQIKRIDMQAPEEFDPLVKQLNQLLDSLDQRLEKSRDALANLSHSVKTPIAAVRQILEDADRPLDRELRKQMANRLDVIDTQLEAEMRRSRFAGPQIGMSAYPLKQARDLLWMLGRLYPNKSFELSSSLPEDCRWAIEEHDLNEIMGNLLDNAGKWSAHYVELTLEEVAGSPMIAVADDGPGVQETELAHLGQRGVRLDEQTPGHGLGLAIVRDIVERYGGIVTFSLRARHGLEVRVMV
ncbi:Virulence sensor histidine kinase PhoQ [Marinobacter litoralis]|uniref:histidine kinase n=1 Tax=Marinobacter litoralis TaxID=187981 RepID=A0A3M2RNC8_9GAMM|nr:ATP-binding protein [Marinobacter litoralis]RMJ06355.1 Virulence sensor histidine kinase PhoQ [Marinobacter litoralis]